MRRYLFLIAILFFASPQIHAQNQYLEGYLVNSSKDTIRGYFFDNNGNWSVKNILFKSTLLDKPVTYSVDQLSSIYIKPYDEYYIVATVNIDKKPIFIHELESHATRRNVIETVLLKLITGGKINLYGYVDENRKSHYFAQKDGREITELGYLKYMTSTTSIAEMPFYIGTLKDLTKDCQKVHVGLVSYTEVSLKKLIEKYNSCFQAKTYTIKKNAGVKVAVGLFGGAKHESFRYFGEDFTGSSPGASDAKFAAKTVSLAGVYLDVLSKRTANPLSIGFQGSYQGMASAHQNVAHRNTYYRDFKIKFTNLSFDFGVKYAFIKKERTTFYTRVDLGFNYLLSYAAIANLQDASNPTLTTEQFAQFKKIGYNFFIAGGFSYRRAFTELRYQHGSFSDATQGNSSLAYNSVDLIAGFRIF